MHTIICMKPSHSFFFFFFFFFETLQNPFSLSRTLKTLQIADKNKNKKKIKTLVSRPNHLNYTKTMELRYMHNNNISGLIKAKWSPVEAP